MGWRFRRSTSFGPFRFTLGKRGMGVSVGVPGARVGIGADGRVRETVGIPGSGLSYQHTIGRLNGGASRKIAHALPYFPGHPAKAQPISLQIGCFGAIALMVGCGAISEKLQLSQGVTAVGGALLLGFPFIIRAWSTRWAERRNEAVFSVYLQRLIDRFGEDNARHMVAGDPWQGATQDMVRVMYGEPDDVSTRVHKLKTSEVWKYVPITKNRYQLRVEFENGVCVGWHTA